MTCPTELMRRIENSLTLNYAAHNTLICICVYVCTYTRTDGWYFQPHTFLILTSNGILDKTAVLSSRIGW